jgi:hypothetical protein
MSRRKILNRHSVYCSTSSANLNIGTVTGFNSTTDVAWSMTFWIKLDSSGFYSFFGGSSGNSSFELDFEFSGTKDTNLAVYITDENSTAVDVTFATDLRMNQWHHVAFVGTGIGNGSVVCYVDGVSASISSESHGAFDPTVDFSMSFGDPFSAAIPGKFYVSDFSLYTTSLTASEVQDIYNNGEYPSGYSRLFLFRNPNIGAL